MAELSSAQVRQEDLLFFRDNISYYYWAITHHLCYHEQTSFKLFCYTAAQLNAASRRRVTGRAQSGKTMRVKSKIDPDVSFQLWRLWASEHFTHQNLLPSKASHPLWSLGQMEAVLGGTTQLRLDNLTPPGQIKRGSAPLPCGMCLTWGGGWGGGGWQCKHSTGPFYCPTLRPKSCRQTCPSRPIWACLSLPFWRRAVNQSPQPLGQTAQTCLSWDKARLGRIMRDAQRGRFLFNFHLKCVAFDSVGILGHQSIKSGASAVQYILYVLHSSEIQ